MRQMIFLPMLLFSAMPIAAADKPYDYRTTDAYRDLSVNDKKRLEQVRHDQVLLWCALDMYAEQHNGNPPETLDELTPKYLKELPSDPFATLQTATAQETGGYSRSKGGFGYLYRRGAPGNRAWVIASVGLADFPYLAGRGNVGLYICKGTWISGVNPAAGRLLNAQPAGAAAGRQPVRKE